MAPIRMEAIILKRIDFRETSVILYLFSRQMGKVKCILKGVRSGRSRVPPLAFSRGSAISAFFYSRRSELGLLSSPCLVESYQMESGKNLAAWHVALGLVNLFTPEREKEEKLYTLLEETGKLFTRLKTPEILFVSFKIKLIRILGYGVELYRCVICGGKDDLLLFSGKLGGTVCRRCAGKDLTSVRISPGVLNITRRLEKTDFTRIGMIRRIPGEMLSKINFYANITLGYHAGLSRIWWEDEKSVLFNNHR